MLVGRSFRAARWPRTLALAAAGLFQLAQLVGLQHEASAPHLVCSEHGEAVHAPARSGASLGLAAPLRSVVAYVAETMPRPRGHDHCPFAGATHAARAAGDGLWQLSDLPPPGPALALDRLGPGLASAQRYLLAPKQSPPV